MKIYCNNQRLNIKELMQQRDNYLSTLPNYMDKDIVNTSYDYPIFEHYAHRFVGQDIWVKVSNAYKEFYYFRFIDVTDSTIAVNFVMPKNDFASQFNPALLEDVALARMERIHKLSIERMVHCFRVIVPLELYSTEEILGMMMGEN